MRGLRPGGFASSTFLLLFLGLVLVEVAAFAAYAGAMAPTRRLAAIEQTVGRLARTYEAVAVAPPGRRAAALQAASRAPDAWRDRIRLAGQPVTTELPPAPPILQRMIRGALVPPPDRAWERPSRVIVAGLPFGEHLRVSIGLADGSAWLDARLDVRPLPPWRDGRLLLPLLLGLAASALLALWAVRRLSAPLVALTEAAERLGRDVNAPPLPEAGALGPAALTFNTMAARLRRFVQERTFLLTAIGHDLRTPITRLKLRTEFLEDEEQQRRFLADLDALEAMVTATLLFGRAADESEKMTVLDLGALLRTVLDEAGDAAPDAAANLHFAPPAHRVTLRGRPIALRRAFANLVGNAVRYAGGATITLTPPAEGKVTVLIEDDGPGIPPAEIERVFDPYHRVEASRNRETGGFGLGLPIARDILHAHGGTVSLANRAAGGLRASVSLPA